MSKKWTQEEVQYIKDNYDNKTARQIAVDLSRTELSIYHKADRLGLKTREMVSCPKSTASWSEVDKEYLRKNYSTTILYDLQEKLGRSQDAIQCMAIKLGLKKEHDIIRLTNSLSSTQINHDYFKTWSSNMAYILGLIYADGCLTSGPGCHRVNITLHIDDGYLLQDILNELDCSNGVYIADNKSSMQISSMVIEKDLTEIGLTPKKSLTIEFPDVPKKYIPHFIRGVLDGDGSITHNNTRPRISIYSGSYDFLDKMDSIISEYLQVPHKSPHKVTGENTCVIRYDGLNCLDLGKWIYKDADMKLARKYKRYTKHEEIWRPRYDSIIKDLIEGNKVRGVSNKNIPSYNRYIAK